VEFEEAVGHHGEIGHHVVGAEEPAERDHHGGNIGVAALFEIIEFPLGLFAPMPGVLEGGDLRVGLMPLRCFEEHGIIALGIKRRIEINEIDTLGGNVFAEDVEVVAEIEFIQNRLNRDLWDYWDYWDEQVLVNMRAIYEIKECGEGDHPRPPPWKGGRMIWSRFSKTRKL
jgi:hypothetical protein